MGHAATSSHTTRTPKRLVALAIIMTSGVVSVGVALADQTGDLRMADIIVIEPPAPGFSEVMNAGATILSSRPIDPAAVTSNAADPLTGLSLSFTPAGGYQRYWVNKRTAEFRGVQAYQLPNKVKPKTFLTDWESGIKDLEGTVSELKDIADARLGEVVISRRTLHQVAFVHKNTAFVVVSGGSDATGATTLALLQQTRAQAGSGAAAPAPVSAAPKVVVAPVAPAPTPVAVAVAVAVAAQPAPAIEAPPVNVVPLQTNVLGRQISSRQRIPRFFELWIGLSTLCLAALAVYAVATQPRSLAQFVPARTPKRQDVQRSRNSPTNLPFG